MKGYIMTVSAAVIIGEILLMLMPDGGIKRFARIALGVLMMLLILAPLRDCSMQLPGPDAESAGVEATYSGVIMDVYNELMHNKNN